MSKAINVCIRCLTAFLVLGLAVIGYIWASSYGYNTNYKYFIADKCAYSLDDNGKATLLAEGVNDLGVTYKDKRYRYRELENGDTIISSYALDFSGETEVLRIVSDLLLEHGDGTGDPEYRIKRLLGVYDNNLYFSMWNYKLRGVSSKVTVTGGIALCRVPISGGEYEVVRQYDTKSGELPEFSDIYNGAVYVIFKEEQSFPVQKFDLETLEMSLVVNSEIQPTFYWLANDRLYFVELPWMRVCYTSLTDALVLENNKVTAPVEVTDDWIYWYSGDFDVFDGTLTLCRTQLLVHAPTLMTFGDTEELVDVPYRGQHVTRPNLISDTAIVYTDPETGKLFYLNPEENSPPVPLGIEPGGAGYGTGYIIQSVNEISPNYDPAELRSTICTFAPPAESIEELREHITVIVRARLTDSVDLSSGYLDTLYTFELLEDFLNTSESEIHLTAEKTSFLEVGGVYYLFMDCLDLPNYPYRVYSLIDPQLIVREYLLNGELVYDFKAKDFCPKTVEEGDIRSSISRLLDTY